MKANANSVPCTLGVAAHGYVNIIISVTIYATLAPIAPFNVPVHPVTLTDDTGVVHYEMALAKTNHEDAIQTSNPTSSYNERRYNDF